jgi:glycosyltransferase involved in cell wall biosynthesis
VRPWLSATAETQHTEEHPEDMALDILMPFYGRFDHFRIAVESVLVQTDRDWRLTIIDDVYPDLAPGEWAQSLGDPRITYIRNSENLRPSRNYNKSVRIATSEFVVLMGCDDVMLPGYVARARELLARYPDAAVVQPGVTVIDENGLPSRPLADRVKRWYRLPGAGPRSVGGEALAVSLLRGNWTYFPSLLWRRELLQGGFRTDLDVVQDLAMLFDIAVSGGAMVVDDEIVFEYRRHSTSVSAVTGFDGSKFLQESILFGEAAATASRLGWTHAARVARRHLSSRLNAASELPRAIVSRNSEGRGALIRHILGLPNRSSRAAS